MTTGIGGSIIPVEHKAPRSQTSCENKHILNSNSIFSKPVAEVGMHLKLNYNAYKKNIRYAQHIEIRYFETVFDLDCGGGGPLAHIHF